MLIPVIFVVTQVASSTLPALPTTPAVLRADISGGIWRVRLRGQVLAVDTGASVSTVDATFLASLPEDAILNFGPVDLSPTGLLGLTLPRFTGSDKVKVDGFIGIDILARLTVGFDREQKTLTLWRGGLDRTRTRAWLLTGRSGSARVVELPTFAVPGDPRPLVSPPDGANSAVMFDSGSAMATVPFGETVEGFHALYARQIKQVDGPHLCAVGWTRKVSLGGLGGGWQLVSRNLAPNDAFWTVGTSFFEGKRLVIDMPNGRLTSTSSDRLVLERTWEEMGLKLSGSRIVLNTPTEGANPDRYFGKEVISVNGMALSWPAAALRRSDRRAYEMLGKLYDEMRKGCPAKVRSGKQIVVVRIKGWYPDLPKDVIVRGSIPAPLAGSKSAPPAVVLPGGQEFDLFPGTCLIPAGWELKNVPSDWIIAGPSGHRKVTVPSKKG